MRLLLAEDELQLAEALEEILKLNKYSVDVVHNGKDALEYIDSVQYDGIILDIMMPYVDGITVLKTIRQKKNTVPVLLLTAKSEIDDKVAGLDSGADDYLTKPFATKELLARIRAMTRQLNEVENSTIKYKNITLCRVTYEISSDNSCYKLTNKEYQLIEMLLNNTGRYISSEQFMEKIWGYNSESEINVVWAHLSSLRRKLEALNADFIIKSSRSLGYILEDKNK